MTSYYILYDRFLSALMTKTIHSLASTRNITSSKIPIPRFGDRQPVAPSLFSFAHERLESEQNPGRFVPRLRR
jgi:hypothetical protein